MTSITPWQAGRFNAVPGKQRLLFGRMFEDVSIELEAFRGKGRVFSIASAGCTAIALSAEHDVVACDINPVQLAYAERRLQGGVIEEGDADLGMAIARRFGTLAGWSRQALTSFTVLDDLPYQYRFWQERLDTWRFRQGFDFLLSRPVLGFAYAPAFLTCLPPNFGAAVRERLARGLMLHANATNPYARLLFLGEGQATAIPGPGHVETVFQDAAGYLESCPPNSFAGFTLSNILDGADAAYRDRLYRAVRRAAAPDAVVVQRSFGEPGPDVSGNQAALDRNLLWGVVEVRPAVDVR